MTVAHADYGSIPLRHTKKSDKGKDMKDLIIAITGQITQSNFPEFEKEIVAKLDEAKKKKLVTDQDFTDAKGTVKFCTSTITAINKVKEQALKETADINTLFAGLDRISDSLRETKTILDTKVKEDFSAKRTAIIDKALEQYRNYVDRLCVKTPELFSFISVVPESFNKCVFRKSKVHTVQVAVDKNLKAEVDLAEAIVIDVETKLESIAGAMVVHGHLFPDKQALLQKSQHDLLATISGRISAYKIEEDRKVLAKKEAEERIKAKAAALKVQIDAYQEKAKEAASPDLLDKKQDDTPFTGFVETGHEIPEPFPTKGAGNHAYPHNVGVAGVYENEDDKKQEIAEDQDRSGVAGGQGKIAEPCANHVEPCDPFPRAADTGPDEGFRLDILMFCSVEDAQLIAREIDSLLSSCKRITNLKLSRS